MSGAMKALSFGPPPSPSSRSTKTAPSGTVTPATSPRSGRQRLASIENRSDLPKRVVMHLNGPTQRSSFAEDQENEPVHAVGRGEGTSSYAKKQQQQHQQEESQGAEVPMDIITSSTSTGSMGGINLVEQALKDQQRTRQTDKARKAGKRRKLGRTRRKPTLHVEVALLPSSGGSPSRYTLIRKAVYEFIYANFDSLQPDSLVCDWEESGLLAKNVQSVRVAECTAPGDTVYIDEVELRVHVYCPSQAYIIDSFSAAPPPDHDGEDEDGMEGAQGGSGEDSDVMAASVAHLPSMALEGVWDNLIYEENIKENLLNYIHATQLFGDKMVDFNVITWNRLVLLHGPPGTGKTSLCRALAQKLSIRLSERYAHGKLVEINSHSIMSKWFSESGKLVQRLFSRVLELVEDEQCFVVVLIDEVESLTTARDAAMGSKEPSDAVRVVNALLTQLDKLKNKKNVLVMTTSNLSGAIDSAFIDRADMKQYIGLPPVPAVYWILLGCIRELMRSGIVRPSEVLDWRALHTHLDAGEEADTRRMRRAVRDSMTLRRLAELCHGMSGRTLRRIPVLAHAKYIASRASFPTEEEESDEEAEEGSEDEASDEGNEDPSGSEGEESLAAEPDADDGSESVEVWLEAMIETVKKEKAQMLAVEQGNGRH